MTDTKKPDTCPTCGSRNPKVRLNLVPQEDRQYVPGDPDFCKDPFHDSRLDYLRKLPVDTSAGGGSTGADTINGRTQKIPGVPEEVITIARELYDRFVMGGWEPQDAYPFLKEIIGESKERMGMETISKLRAELKQVRAATRVETAPDDIEKLVRDWYYAPGKIVGPDNLAAFVREIVAAQAAEIERLTQALEERNNRGTGFLYCPAASRDKWKSRAEAAEALVEEMRALLSRTTAVTRAYVLLCKSEKLQYAQSEITAVEAEALLDRSRKGNGA